MKLKPVGLLVQGEDVVGELEAELVVNPFDGLLVHAGCDAVANDGDVAALSKPGHHRLEAAHERLCGHALPTIRCPSQLHPSCRHDEHLAFLRILQVALRREAAEDALSVWRADDEALLQRLENEELLAALWRDLLAEPEHYGAAPRALPPPPHARASGMLALVRESAEGERAAARALDGDRSALHALLTPPSMAALRPPLLHHLALFFGAIGRSAPTTTRACDAYVRSTAAWIALGAEGTYLPGLVSSVAGEALSDTERAEIVRSAPLAHLRTLAERGRASAGERSRDAQLALRVLAQAEEAIRLSGTRAWDERSEEGVRRRKRAPIVDEARRECRRLRLGILDNALSALADGLDVATGQSPNTEHMRLLDEVVETWEWADRDFEVERFLVERATPIGWELYNARRWDMLRRMTGILRAPVDSLVERVASDPAMLPYAARAAQMLVFRAEMEPRLSDQIVAAKRAVEICPTHRNGRLVYSDVLAERALQTLRADGFVPRRSSVDAAREDVELARSLWKSGKRLQQAIDELRRHGVHL